MRKLRLSVVALAVIDAAVTSIHAQTSRPFRPQAVRVDELQSIGLGRGGGGGLDPAIAAQINQAMSEAKASEKKEHDAQSSAIAAVQNQRNEKALVGVDQRIVEFLKKRIEEGSGSAAFDLAKRHETGQGVKRDATEARRLYKLSAERGNEEAEKWLAAHPEPKKEIATQATNPPVK